MRYSVRGFYRTREYPHYNRFVRTNTNWLILAMIESICLMYDMRVEQVKMIDRKTGKELTWEC